LGYLERGGADLVAVADADLTVTESFDGEVLAELSVDEVVTAELAFPVAIRVDLVNEHRALLPAVPGEIALAVALDVQLADAAGTADGVLEDTGKNRLPLPRHVLRHANVDRQQPPHNGATHAARRGMFTRSCWSRIVVQLLLQLLARWVSGFADHRLGPRTRDRVVRSR